MSSRTEKICYTCQESKTLDSFSKRTSSGDKYEYECKSCKRVRARNYYERHKEEVQARNRHHDRVLAAKNWKKVFDHYGCMCVCCGETEQVFLSVDHINGGGRKHRKEIGQHIERWLVKNDFPEGFQIMCHNCNWAKHRLGVCPHRDVSRCAPS